MKILSAPPLSTLLRQRAHEAAGRLEAVPFYARLLEGAVSAEEYAAWLVQMHKYVRHTSRSLRALVAATAAAPAASRQEDLHAYARREAEEEAGHDELLLRDLAALWGGSADEALGRVERAVTCPAAAGWQAQLDTLLCRCPEGIVGFALALETVAALHADRIRAALVGRAPRLAGATAFLEAHRAEVEETHGEAGAARIDRLQGARARGAASYCAGAALNLYEGIAWFLSERFDRDGAEEARP